LQGIWRDEAKHGGNRREFRQSHFHIALNDADQEPQHVQHTPGILFIEALLELRELIRLRYVLDIGQSEDWLALQVSMAPCLIGYGDIARRLHDDPKTKREGNIYWKWIETYVADDYCEAVRVGSGEFSYTVDVFCIELTIERIA